MKTASSIDDAYANAAAQGFAAVEMEPMLEYSLVES